MGSKTDLTGLGGFKSKLALRVAQLAFLGFLAALGFIPGWERLFGFSGFFGFFGVGVIIEAIARLSK